MATKRSRAKASRQVHEPPVTAEPEDDESSLSHSSALDDDPSLAERVQAQREQIFKAISIVECCKNASATQLAVDDLEYMIPAFDAVRDLLNTAAGELERIASAVPKTRRGGRTRVDGAAD